MEINGKDDYFARCLHALCAIPLLLFVLFVIYLFLQGSFFNLWVLCRGGAGIGAAWLAYRLLKYAITGRDNINREDFQPPFM